MDENFHLFSFEKLHVWNEIRVLIQLIYASCRHFPNDELFGLASQIKSTSISVGSNIAEGSAWKTKKEQAHFYTMAYSSLMEVLAQTIIARDLKYMHEDDSTMVSTKFEIISRMINALRKSLNQ